MYNPKRCRGNKTHIKTKGPELRVQIYFKVRCSDLEGYVFDIGPRASDKFYRIMKELDDIYTQRTLIDVNQTS